MHSPAADEASENVFPPELAELAAAYGVATHYENSEQVEVQVEAEVVVAVLAQFDVDAATPEAIAAALAVVRGNRRSTALPPTLVVPQGQERALGRGATVELEDGTTREVGATLPADLPLGWHHVVTAEQRVTLAVVPARLPDVPPAWGWMLQLYALHSDDSWGMGDFGDLRTVAARSAAELDAGVLLVNPVQAFSPAHPVERSPYSPSSRRFANPIYLRVTDTEAFARADEDTRARVLALAPAEGGELIDYDAVWTAKRDALELLRPHHPHPVELDDDLRDFATFGALAEVHGADWRGWPEALRDPSSSEVARAREELAARVEFHGWLQQLCHEQLGDVRRAAREAGMPVGVVHDLPVGVHPGGADTWARRDVFAANVRVGAPPDTFNQLGQDWNLPPWRPDRLAEAGYAPFRDVVRGVLQYADGIRVDHIAGLWRLWWIPPGEPAGRGTYVHYDAEAMVGVLALEAHRAGAVVVGEDLGTVEDTVTETMQARGMLSSAVLWFQRDWDAPGQPFVRPARWAPEAMASISTHDLPTVSGWLEAEHVRVRAGLGLLDRPAAEEYADAAAERAALLDLLEREGIPGGDLVVALHTLLASAASRLVLTSPADVTGQRRQPNLPGTTDQYPNWRIPLPVTVDGLFADPRVHAAVAPLKAARPLP
ncbi:4-alpha-glucanotransferase [Amycolatopsis sp. PS_44_ISF1]|uniref:4-alpha-glucanotransferase n=1 Tax=Amycolatopsis sp. PS_44_ISF1 TaxID=2974917 RepID=UPI0028DE99D3|nr:4-alpha-glucanotransferase [Amycolatopsis sp. PS_44_ISF1]MDT8915303.1 4-alpha-glucanotransferase [Amycolatopsis sp. PS_44_ISF1]